MTPILTAAAKVKLPKNPRLEVYQGKSDWRWRLIARNGEIVDQSEGYTSEKDAYRGYEAVERAVLSVAKSGSGRRRPKRAMARKPYRITALRLP